MVSSKFSDALGDERFDESLEYALAGAVVYYKGGITLDAFESMPMTKMFRFIEYSHKMAEEARKE